ncbi:MAG: hypothetical protein U0573_03020 [Phycisphaerales bacterium]|nr:hypothetical protein [Planctomycetota bacterium]
MRELSLKYWLVGGPFIAPGADPFWKQHAFTRRRRMAAILLLTLGVVSVTLLVIYIVSMSLSSPGRAIKLPFLFILLPWLAVRIVALPVNIYFIMLALRVRRAGGRVCPECGRNLSADTCSCSKHWGEGELRRFWLAAGLLPGDGMELKLARLQNPPAPAQVSFFWRAVFPLHRNSVASWLQRPLTTRWLQRAMRRGALVSTVSVLFVILLAGPIAAIFAGSSFWKFAACLALVGACALASQMLILRWSLAREIRRARAQVLEAGAMLCTDCGFSLQGLPEAGKCPECADDYTAAERRSFFASCGLFEAPLTRACEAAEKTP